MKVKRTMYCIIGFIGLGLGAVGAVVPMLPAFPFLLLAAFGFAKSSPRLHQWFVNTSLYKKNLDSFVQGKGMTKQVKIRVMVTVTLLMGFGFLMMHRVPVGRAVLAVIWLLHMLYFLFGVKTIQMAPAQRGSDEERQQSSFE